MLVMMPKRSMMKTLAPRFATRLATYRFRPAIALMTTTSVVTAMRSEEHTSELQSPDHLVYRLLLATTNVMNVVTSLLLTVMHTLFLLVIRLASSSTRFPTRRSSDLLRLLKFVHAGDDAKAVDDENVGAQVRHAIGHIQVQAGDRAHDHHERGHRH